jgi:predicted metal-dependent HD superfamily phosphohydrolase
MDPTSLDRLRPRWQQAVAPFGADARAVESAFADLAARYCEPGRHYHTLDHIAAVLDALDAPSPALPLAAWYHDVIYDTRAADNEERSAELARAALPALGVPPDVVEEAARLILLTKTHRASEGDTAGWQLLDADLAVLGAEPAAYDRYASAIRQEYAWVPEGDYRAGRSRVLEGFLARPRLYHLRTDAEGPARRNLQREIAQLRGK